MKRPLALFAALFCGARAAAAAPPTHGYDEPVVQWGVQKGETCEDIARALYGSPKYTSLLQRYNHIACKAGAPLREGLTLVLPEKPTTLPDAKLRSMNPDVRARPGGGGWAAAATGMPLYSNYNVNTLDKGRADVEFIDRTRVYLAENTLVVIFGTASQTRVSKTPPAAVEVESGEVKAGLAALRGDAVEVAIKGGGRISAASRDTVVQRKGDRTTVEVFDGKAGVTSGGKSVEVPRNFGSRFVGVAPPIPPRPLPPAPRWAPGDSGMIELVKESDTVGVLSASWTPTPEAVAYRVDVWQGDKLIAREEAPARVTSFVLQTRLDPARRVETYALEVRAIDKEEFLGIASERRTVNFVKAGLESGRGTVKPREIEANPYGFLLLPPLPPGQAEMAIDDGPFGPVQERIDLRRRAPQKLRFRARGEATFETIPIRYSRVGAHVALTRAGDRGKLAVTFDHVEDVDVPARIAPSARVHLPDGVRTVALTRSGEVFAGAFTLPAGVDPSRIDVVDDRGAVLGTAQGAAAGATPDAPRPPAPAPIRDLQIGAYAPLWQVSPVSGVLPFAPTPPDGASVSAGVVRARTGWALQGQARASGSIGPVGLDAALRSNGTGGDTTADSSAWLGVRYRVLRLGQADLEVAPSLRAGFPASAAAAPVRIEPALGVGGVAGRFTWLLDVGARLRAKDDHGTSGTPPAQGFVLAGGTMDVLSWLRINAALDAHLVYADSGARSLLAGLGAGIEAGGAIFGGLGFRASPWTEPGLGPFTAQLSLGFRGRP